jgi:hypothetical protein
MKTFLKSTLAATALAMTLQAIKNIIYYTPLQEDINAWLEESLVAYGFSTLIFGFFAYVCFLLLGFAISSSRDQLPALSPCMRTQMIIIAALITCRLVWYIIFYSIGWEDVPQIYSQIAGYVTTVQNILTAAWLWQLTFSKQGTFQSDTLGEAGKSTSWAIIVASVLWIASIIVLSTRFEGDTPRFLYSIMTYVFLVIFIRLIVTYYSITREHNITNDIK